MKLLSNYFLSVRSRKIANPLTGEFGSYSETETERVREGGGRGSGSWSGSWSGSGSGSGSGRGSGRRNGRERFNLNLKVI